MSDQGIPAPPPSREPGASAFFTAVRNAILQLQSRPTATTSSAASTTTVVSSGWVDPLATEAATRASADSAEEAARIAADDAEAATRASADAAEIVNRNNAIADAMAGVPYTYSSLLDVKLTSIANYQIPQWITPDNKWENVSLAEGTGISITYSSGTITLAVTGYGASPLTTKGDLFSFDTADARLPVGTDGQLLSADSTQPLGLKWITASGTGTVTSVGGTGTVNGITLTGSVTSAGNLTLGGTLSGVDLTSQVTGTLPIANGGTNASTASAARTNLGVEAWSAQLDSLAGISYTSDSLIYQSAADTFSKVTLGTGLSLSSGTLSASGGGGGLYDISMGVPTSGMTTVGSTTYYAFTQNGSKGFNTQLISTIASSYAIGGNLIPAPTAPFHVAFLMLQNGAGYSYAAKTVGFYNSANGYFSTLNNFMGENNDSELHHWTNNTTRASVTSLAGGASGASPLWMHLKSDGTTLYFGMSHDGATPFWFPYTETIASFLTGLTHVFAGIFTNNLAHLVSYSCTCLCYDDNADARVIGV
jgi:hypothetical protein